MNSTPMPMQEVLKLVAIAESAVIMMKREVMEHARKTTPAVSLRDPVQLELDLQPRKD
jgi:hypothetical protein